MIFLGLLLLVVATGFAQSRAIKGKVTSAKDKSPVAGASVVIKGKTGGTTSGADGSFSINATGEVTLVVS